MEAIVYDKGLVKGGLNTWLPPQELLTVKIPELGGLEKVTVPVRSYVLKVGLHAPGVAVTAEIAQGTTLQGCGEAITTE